MWKGEVVITKLLFVIPGTCYDAADTVLVGTKTRSIVLSM